MSIYHAKPSHLPGAQLPCLKVCQFCKKTEKVAEIVFCKGCFGTRYCSRKCQVADWKSHKPHCYLGPCLLMISYKIDNFTKYQEAPSADQIQEDSQAIQRLLSPIQAKVTEGPAKKPDPSKPYIVAHPHTMRELLEHGPLYEQDGDVVFAGSIAKYGALEESAIQSAMTEENWMLPLLWLWSKEPLERLEWLKINIIKAPHPLLCFERARALMQSLGGREEVYYWLSLSTFLTAMDLFCHTSTSKSLGLPLFVCGDLNRKIAPELLSLADYEKGARPSAAPAVIKKLCAISSEFHSLIGDLNWAISPDRGSDTHALTLPDSVLERMQDQIRKIDLKRLHSPAWVGDFDTRLTEEGIHGMLPKTEWLKQRKSMFNRLKLIFMDGKIH